MITFHPSACVGSTRKHFQIIKHVFYEVFPFTSIKTHSNANDNRKTGKGEVAGGHIFAFAYVNQQLFGQKLTTLSTIASYLPLILCQRERVIMRNLCVLTA